LSRQIIVHHYICASFSSIHHFFFKRPPPTEISTLSLHDALPIYLRRPARPERAARAARRARGRRHAARIVHPHRHPALDRRGRADRKSTRLNSSHVAISYAVFCLKKKKKNNKKEPYSDLYTYTVT